MSEPGWPHIYCGSEVFTDPGPANLSMPHLEGGLLFKLKRGIRGFGELKGLYIGIGQCGVPQINCPYNMFSVNLHTAIFRHSHSFFLHVVF